MRPEAVRRPRQQGFALLELTVALMIGTLLLIWGAAALMRQADDAAARATGAWLLEIRNAAYRMMERHFDTLSEGKPPVGPEGAPLYADMYAPTLAEFKAQGLLPSSFPESAPMGGTARIRYAAPSACPGEACRVDALVYASAPLSDRLGLPDMMRMAAFIETAGGYGGYATSGTASRLRGKIFDFSNPHAPGSEALPAGTPVAWAGMDMATAAQYVRRFDERDPQLKAGLTVAGAVTGKSLQANEYLQIGGQASPGSPCAPNGLVGRTPEGQLLSCQSGLWVGSAGLGLGQRWSNPNYGYARQFNNSQKPIFVQIYGQCGSWAGEGNWAGLVVDEVLVGRWYASFTNNASGGSAGAVVPPGSSFYATTNNGGMCNFGWAQLS